MGGKVLTRSFQRTIYHRNLTEGREDIRVLRSVANGLVEGTSGLQNVVAQSIPAGIN